MRFQTLLRCIAREREGNIAIAAALTAPLILYGLSLGVDYGMLTLQQRQLQQTADLAAIIAASDVNNAQANMLTYFQQNNLDMAIRTDSGYASNKGNFSLTDSKGDGRFDGVATLSKGTYVPDPAVPLGSRFVAGAQPYNAVKVAVQQTGGLFFAAAISAPPKLMAVGTASTQKVAAFSIGSRLASVNEGLLNAVLGGLLGTTVSLKAMDYQSLISADVNALSVIDALATNVNLTAGSYNDLLATKVTLSDFLKAMGSQTGLSATAKKAIQTLQTAANTTQIKLDLADVLTLGPTGQRIVGSGSNPELSVNVMDLISAAALAANGSKQIGVDLGASIPGLAGVTLTLAIGEPPQGTPPLAVGAPGTIVRTAQTRLKLVVSVNGLSLLLGLKIQVPLYVEVAYAEGKLASITCLGGGAKNANVSVEAVPGVAEVALGDVDTSKFANFSSKPRVDEAKVLDSLLIKATAKTDINITNMTKSTLTFSPNDISNKTYKTVSTKDTLTSTVSSLLGQTSFTVSLGPLSLTSPALIQQALAATLSGITAPLDDLLSNLLLLLGVKIGEADIRVTDVRCQQPVLVQ